MTGGESEPLRVMALVPTGYDTSPGQRFRIEQWERLLRREAIDIHYRPFESDALQRILHQPRRYGAKALLAAAGLARRARDIAAARRYDLVYIFREAALVGPGAFERMLGRSGTPVVFDFDDAVFLPSPSPTHGSLTRLKFPGKTATTCRLAAHVMAGNEYLASYARQFNSAVTVVPTTIDPARYVTPPQPPREVPVIGWTGSHSTIPYLDTLRPVFQRLAGLRDFELRVIGTDKPYLIPGVRVRSLPWRAETEIADLAPIDLGVMPLPDNPWTQGKCALKALQYFALGVPAVCSPVGVNVEVVHHGVNGFLASTPDEWLSALTTLIDDPALRAIMGTAGRERAQAIYSAEVQAPRVAEVFRQAVATGERVIR